MNTNAKQADKAVKDQKTETASDSKTSNTPNPGLKAVVQLDCKQFFVQVGSKIKCELLEAQEGQELTFDKVLLLDNKGEIQVGAPYVSGTKVTFKVLEHGRGKKVIIFKKNRRHVYQKKQGHRQNYTQLEVLSIK